MISSTSLSIVSHCCTKSVVVSTCSCVEVACNWSAACSMDAAGRGRGRGATLPAWMTQGISAGKRSNCVDCDPCMYSALACTHGLIARLCTGKDSADLGVQPAATQQSTPGPATAASTANGAASKPAWTEHTAPDGRKYYYNASTKQSVWQKPAELLAAVRTTPHLHTHLTTHAGGRQPSSHL